MKDLWEQYGLIIIAIFVSAALIGLAVVMSNRTSDNIENNVSRFEQVGDSVIDDALDGNEAATTAPGN